MHVGGDKLFVLFAALVVEYLEVHCNPFVFEALHDHVIGLQSVCVLSRLEWLDEDYVRRVVGHHHSLVSLLAQNGNLFVLSVYSLL